MFTACNCGLSRKGVQSFLGRPGVFLWILVHCADGDQVIAAGEGACGRNYPGAGCAAQRLQANTQQAVAGLAFDALIG